MAGTKHEQSDDADVRDHGDEDEVVEEKDEHSSGLHRSLFFYLLGYIQSLSSSLHVYFVYPRLSKGLTLGSVNRKTATNHKNFLVTPRKNELREIFWNNFDIFLKKIKI